VKGRLTILAAVLAAVAIAVAGCGGSKKSSAETTTTTTTTTTTGSTGGTSSSSSSGTSSSGTSSSGTSSSGSGSATASQRCIQFAGFASKFADAFKGTGDVSTDSQKLKSYFQALADKAPSDIKSSFKTFADAFAKYLDAIKGIDLKAGQTPSADDLAKLQSAAKELDRADVKAASQKIEAWVQGGCK
jgi:hypothetical protein